MLHVCECNITEHTALLMSKDTKEKGKDNRTKYTKRPERLENALISSAGSASRA